MAEYKAKLMTAVKEAMKSKDNERRDTIRQLQAAIKQIEVDEQKDLTDEEEKELAIIESFLPEQMSEEEIRALAQQAIDETGASEMRDMGKVMGKLTPQTKGKADGKLVSTIVRELLNS